MTTEADYPPQSNVFVAWQTDHLRAQVNQPVVFVVRNVREGGVYGHVDAKLFLGGDQLIFKKIAIIRALTNDAGIPPSLSHVSALMRDLPVAH